jgi:hypothetical protein
MSMATGSSFGLVLLVRGGSGYQSDRTGVSTWDEPFDVPADLGLKLRHAIQIAAIMAIETGVRDLGR